MVAARPAGKAFVRTAGPAFILLILISIFGTTAFALEREPISIGWRNAANRPLSLTMSAEGRYFGCVDADGTVRFFNRRGNLLWKKKVAGATNVLIARNGESLLVYSRQSKVNNSIFFLRKDGLLLWHHQVEGSVYSGAISSDGTMAAVTTDRNHIYVYTPDPRHPKFRRWRLDGIGYQVIFTPDSKQVLVGTWQESALVCYDIRGRFQWRDKYDKGQRFDLNISADGRRIIGLIPGTQKTPRMELRLWESGSKELWRKNISDFDGRALISPRSQYVAISHASFLSKDHTGMIERKVSVYDVSGRLLWQKGGLFFGPRLVALSPTGESVIVSDGEKSLFNINRRGKILSKHVLSGTILKTLSSEDGRFVLLYCSDGWLYMMRVG